MNEHNAIQPDAPEQLCADPACADRAALLATLALGGELTIAEREETLSALTSCAGCRERLAAYAGIAEQLPLAAPLAEPPPNLRDRIVQAAAGQAPTPAPRQRRSWAINWRRLMLPGLSALLAVLLVAIGIQQQQITQQGEQLAQLQATTGRNAQLVIAAFGNEDAREGQLTASANAPGASGRFFVSPSAPALSIYVRQLPQLATGQIYQVWVTHNGQTVSVGSFPVNPQGRAWRPLQPPAALGTVERVFVTIEPAAGSQAPSGPEVLSGAPES